MSTREARCAKANVLFENHLAAHTLPERLYLHMDMFLKPREDESTVGFKTGYPARAKPQISSKEKSCERQLRIESAF